jgi:hypothetical protein
MGEYVDIYAAFPSISLGLDLYVGEYFLPSVAAGDTEN